MSGQQEAIPISEFVIATLASAANIDRETITEDTDVFELGIDSLAVAAVISQVEMQYSCEVPLDEVYALLDASLVRDIVAIVGRVAVGNER